MLPLAAICVLGVGIAIGLLIPFNTMRNVIASSWANANKEAGDPHDDEADHSEEEIVALTEAAYDGLGVFVGVAKKGEYRASYDIPAVVGEMPGVSQLHVGTRFEGLLRKVFVLQGQSVKPGDKLCEIELTSESLALAQTEFLEAWQNIAIVNSEIARIDPFIKQGVMPQKRLIELEYEKKRLEARARSKSQELVIRGLTQKQIESIKQNKELIRRVTIFVPHELVPPQAGGNQVPETEQSFIIGALKATTGTVVKTGDHIVELEYHQRLVVVGHAFESDLPSIRQAVQSQSEISIFVGTGQNEFRLENQRIAFVANHADPESSTFPFYIYIDNEKIGEDQRSHFVQWRWKPGQRAHVAIPSKQFKDVIVLPRQAVAVDGVRYLAFRRHEHEEEHDESVPHEHMMEFEAVDLVVLHMDQKKVVIEANGDLKPGEVIAVNKATELLFGLQNSSGDGGHHHHH